MPIWGWVCVGLAVVGVIFIVYLNLLDARRKKYTLTLGTATHGWLVQAHSNAFKDGNMNEAGLLVISTDEGTNNDEEFMTGLAERIMELKGEEGETKVERKVARLMADETYLRGRWDELPAEFAGGRTVYLVHFMIYRDHLPEKKLTGRKIPCAIIWAEPGTLVCTRPVTRSKRRRDEDDDNKE